MTKEPYASARRVFWIVDNGSAHRGQKEIDRLEGRWPKLVLVHLPLHASWLNQIEIYFSIVQRKVLEPSDFLRQRPQPGDDFLSAGAEAGAVKLSALPSDRGGVGRAGVDVQTHPCQGCGHGRTLLPLHGVSRSQSPARQTPDP